MPQADRVLTDGGVTGLGLSGAALVPSATDVTQAGGEVAAPALLDSGDDEPDNAQGAAL